MAIEIKTAPGWVMLEAERSLLGAIILEATGQPESGIIRHVAQIVQPQDFMDYSIGDHLHSRIYQAMLFIHGPMNEITITAEILKRYPLPKDTYSAFPLFNSICPSWLDWESYTQAVKEYSKLRNPNYRPRNQPRGGATL